MDKLKNVLQRDKEGTQDVQNPQSSTVRGVGQGSHLSKATTSAEGNSGAFVAQPTTQPSLGTSAGGISSTSRDTGDNIGSVAVGETSTYSSHTLRHGDAVGSVIDRTSRDPTTYKMPEHTFGQTTGASGEHSSSGVPAGAAGTAASVAFNKHNDQSTSNIPGAFPKESAHDTVTLPPVNRPIDYEAGRAAPDSTQSSSAAGPVGSSGVSSETPATTGASRSGTLGKILGAVGLGGAATGAGVAASKAGDDRSHAVTDTPSQPTTTTGTDSYTAPTLSGHPTSHHRKESIPTTAYPAGVGSPSPIHSPVGGTRGAPDETNRMTSSTAPSGTEASSYTIGGPGEGEERSHAGRNAGLATAGLGAGAGAAALGAHEYGKDRGDASGTTASSVLPGTAQTTSSSTFPSSGQGVTSSSIPSTTQGTSGYGRDQTAGTSGYSTGTPSQISSTQQPEHQSSGYGKTAAVAGLGAGAGALGAHEYGKEREDGHGPRTSSALPGTAQPTSTSTSTYPSSGQGLASSSIPSTTQGASGYGRDQPAGTGYPAGPTSQTSGTQQEQQSSGYGKAATAAGLGAGAGALGAHEYGKHRGGDTQPTSSSTFAGTQSSVPAATHNTTSSGLPQTTGTGLQHGTARDQPVASSGPTSQLSSREQENHSTAFGKTAAATGLGACAGAAGTSALQHDRKPESTQQYGDRPLQADQGPTQSSSTTGTHLPIREKAATQTPVTSTRDNVTGDHSKEDSHTGRNTALAGAAGAGAAGAYGAHEHNKHQAEEDAERRQKDIAEQEAARQKQYEKDQKATEKLAHKEEKQHEKDMKKLEKEEKSHEKESKKEEKAHQKGVAKEEKEQQKELDSEEKERKRHEKEAAAAAGTAGAGGAAYAAHHHDSDNTKGKLASDHHDDSERSKLHKDPPEQKKPGFFRRIFKRRKNKDTGDSEDYSTDEEDHAATTGTHHGGAGTAAGIGAAGAGAGLAGTSSGDSKTYDSKPSYNPLSKDDPSSTSTTTTGNTSTLTGTHGTHGTHDPTSTSATHGTHGTGTGMGSGMGTGTGNNELPIDDVTGLPYDPAKDPEAAKRLQTHDTLGHRILEKAEAKEAQQEGSGPAPLS